MAANIFLDLPGGLKMPALGIGTWQVKDENELKVALNAALEAGYRHIDTAFAYQNEEIIGNVLKEWFNSGKLKREDVFITTKLPMQAVQPDKVEFHMKKSLENLQLDYVDLYLIHCPINGQMDANRKFILGPKTDHVGVWKKMEEQVDSGRTKTIGVSNYNISQIQTILNFARIKPANLQVEIHVYLQQRKLVDFCHKNGITVVAYSPLASPGYNKFLKGLGVTEDRQLPDILGDSVVAKISKKHSKTPAQIVLRFLVQKGIAAIPKSVTVKRVQENIAIFDFNLDDGDMKELTNLEVGDSARVCDFKLIKGMEEHPDYPFERN